jgi:hypothetical protein
MRAMGLARLELAYLDPVVGDVHTAKEATAVAAPTTIVLQVGQNCRVAWADA